MNFDLMKFDLMIISLLFLFIHLLLFNFHWFIDSFIFIHSISFVHFHFSSRTSCWKAHWRLTTCRASWPSSLLPTVPWGNTPAQKTTTLFSIIWVQNYFVIVALMFITTFYIQCTGPKRRQLYSQSHGYKNVLLLFR